jgi:aspartyl-tRNA(Asn)/glutamyl-tRNA(Gln) amidotransferase subunit C
MFDLEKLESLGKIKLTDDERAEAVEYFNGWIEKFDKLASIDTENVEPLISVSSLENVMREDIAYKLFDRDKLLENTPEQQDGYIVVPRILE